MTKEDLPARRGRGRPRKIESPEEFAALADRYFQRCAKTRTPVTLTGLCLGLGLSGRPALLVYGRRPEFEFVVGRARLIVENEYEQALLSKNCAGARFALTAMGWRDGPEKKDERPSVTVEFNVTFTDRPKADVEDGASNVA